MPKPLRILLILALIFSPLWVGALTTINQPSDSVSGLVLFISLIIGTPIIAVVGIIISFVVRKRANANLLSIIGYAIPAVLVCCYELFVALS